MSSAMCVKGKQVKERVSVCLDQIASQALCTAVQKFGISKIFNAFEFNLYCSSGQEIMYLIKNTNHNFLIFLLFIIIFFYYYLK